MKPNVVIASLAALAQKIRLAAFRHLVQAGPSGSRPGDIAEALGVSPSTLSFHLKALSHAGLVSAEQDGRNIIYRANYQAMQGLVDYLTDNCCGGDATMCAPNPQPARAPRSAAGTTLLPRRNSRAPKRA